MVKYGDSVNALYKEIKRKLRRIEIECMREIRTRAQEGSPYQVIGYAYRLQACSIIKNAISDNPGWHFEYDVMYNLTKYGALKRLVNNIADKTDVLKAFKSGSTTGLGSQVNKIFNSCLDTVSEIKADKTPKLRYVADTNLVVAKNANCKWSVNNKRVERELGYSVLLVKIRENNFNDKRFAEGNILYALDTPENREIIKKYYGEVLGSWSI